MWFQLTCQMTAVTWVCTCETYRRTACWAQPKLLAYRLMSSLYLDVIITWKEPELIMLRGNVSDLRDFAGSQAKDRAMLSWEGWGSRWRKRSKYPSSLEQVNFELQPSALWFLESPFTKTSLKDRGKNKKKIIIGERVNMKVRDGVYHSFILYPFKK